MAWLLKSIAKSERPDDDEDRVAGRQSARHGDRTLAPSACRRIACGRGGRRRRLGGIAPGAAIGRPTVVDRLEVDRVGDIVDGARRIHGTLSVAHPARPGVRAQVGHRLRT